MTPPSSPHTKADNVKDVFKRHFGYTPPHVVKAPGRLELLGNHTDYNDGVVMSVAVDRYIHMAIAPRTDGKIELVSSAFPEPELFWMSEMKKNPAAPWADYVKGVLAQLRRRGVHFSGFNAALWSDIPMGAGMSSSAALEVATALAVRQLYPFGLGATGCRRWARRSACTSRNCVARRRMNSSACRAAFSTRSRRFSANRGTSFRLTAVI